MDLDFPDISKPKGLGSSSMHGSCNYLPIPYHEKERGSIVLKHIHNPNHPIRPQAIDLLLINAAADVGLRAVEVS